MSIAAMNWAWRLRLKPSIKLVLMALADAADDDGYCWPSIPTLSIKTCMDERSVQRILKALKTEGLVLVQARFRKDGSPTSNKYQLALINHGDSLSLPQPTECHQAMSLESPDGGSHVTQTTIEPSPNTPPPQPSSSASKEQSSSGDGELVFSNKLSPAQVCEIRIRLVALETTVAQQVLDELAGRLKISEVRNPIGYCNTLIRKALNNEFSAELGIQIAETRQTLAAREAQKLSGQITQKNDSKPLTQTRTHPPEEFRQMLNFMKSKTSSTPVKD